MSLVDQIAQQTKDAMKAGDAATVGTLRLVTAQFQNVIKEKRGEADATLTDDEALRVLEREAKKRREAATLYRQGGREELAVKEEQELALIVKFLPAQMTDDELATLMDEKVAAGANDFKSLMKEMSAATRGRADGAKVAAMVKERMGAPN